jgi:hypothetical protein
MKHVARMLSLLALGALIAAPASAELKTPRPSPNATATQVIGITDAKITYSRPSVKGRKIWGGLVPYGQPWRTGANEATTVTFSSDVTVQGQKLPAGAYSLYTVPTEGEWTVVFNKGKELPSSDAFKKDDDVVRVQVKPELVGDSQESLSLGFENVKLESADLVLRWEKLRLPVAIGVETVAPFLASARTEIAAAKADDWRTPYQAANTLFTFELEPALAKEWVEKSVKVQENHTNLSLKARMHAKAGDTKLAIATGEKAVKAGKASKDKVDTSATEKLVAEWSAKK